LYLQAAKAKQRRRTATAKQAEYVAPQHKIVNSLKKFGIFVLQCARNDQIKVGLEARVLDR
jgi:hypothetical protein